MAQHMVRAKESDGDLPYGMPITIFLPHFQVPHKGEVTLEESQHYAINKSTLFKMDFKKYGDTWNLLSRLAGKDSPPTSPI